MADDQKNGESVLENIVLFGRTGNGKSATANSIIGRKGSDGKNLFKSQPKAGGVTMVCKAETVEIDVPGSPVPIQLNVIDTPGLLDPTFGPEISQEIIHCLNLTKGGLHAVILVLNARNPFSDEEEKVLSTLEVIFGKNIVNNLIVLFTCGDELDESGVKIKEYLEESPDILKKLLVSCENRVVVFDNKTKDEAKKKKQVQELLNLIDLVRKRKDYKPYTEGMYLQKIKEENVRHLKVQKDLADQEHSDEDFEKLLKEIILLNEQNLKAMSEMMEKDIKIITEAQAKMFEQRAKEEDKRHAQDEETHRQEMQELMQHMDGNMRKEQAAQMAMGACQML